MELSIEIKEQIKKDSRTGIIRFPDCDEDKAYNNGLQDGYKEGATEYAEKWQEAQRLVDRYEKALKEISEFKQTFRGENAIYDILTGIAHEALTPKTGSDE